MKQIKRSFYIGEDKPENRGTVKITNIYGRQLMLILLIPLFFAISCSTGTKKETKEEPLSPKTALQHYLHNGDKTFKYEIKDKYTIDDNVTAFDILLTSQNWRDHIWTHQLTVFVPKEIKYDGALLFITGGRIKDGLPEWKSKESKKAKRFAYLAKKNSAITAVLRQTPNQPLYGGLVEDQLISYTLHHFKKDGDFTWPLLFPMVKSAVRAMDVVQNLAEDKLKTKITRFTVSGASKRGWTTWLTGANDPRVEAIGPMVIDVLDMPVSLDYQVEVWHEYSPQIEDYTKLEIPQSVNTKSGNAITTMVDPYSYRKNLTMPKIIFNGTNDEYWPVDAIKNYIDSIPGENYLHYTPNAGHDLDGGAKAIKALSAFWEKTLKKEQYNKFEYNVSSNNKSVTISISTDNDIVNSYLWSAVSEDRDFRNEKWTAVTLGNSKSLHFDIDLPEKGFKAFYVDLEFTDPNGGTYTKSTRMYVVNEKGIL